MADSFSFHQSEMEFHDLWAKGTSLEAIRVREAFESITAPENRLILAQMGPLNGKRILDVGAGLGESSVYFALQGAEVTATDLSPAMLETAQRLAALHQVNIECVQSPAEHLKVPEGAFDFVYAANVLHHVAHKRAMLQSMSRALKPGGRFFSIDPLAYNPVINVYRNMASDVRTRDEAPLRFSDTKLAGEFFTNVEHREFWVATLALFLKYYLMDRVHPNEDRYWKRIYRETPQSLWWWRPLAAADRVLTRLPLARRMAWNMVMWGEKT